MLPIGAGLAKGDSGMGAGRIFGLGTVVGGVDQGVPFVLSGWLTGACCKFWLTGACCG